jgi:cysteine synthase A
MRYNNILETIGNTPHVRINRLFGNAEVWLKLERANPGGSIKDRIGLAMVEDAERRGVLKKGSVIIEATSGNTGIALALAGAVKGYRVILVMPDSMSIERRRVLTALGATVELTPREQGINGSIARAKELAAQHRDSWIPNQFENPANVEAHRTTTAREILADFPEGIDYLITGVGTGGHITGVSEVLKKKFPKMQTFAVEPEKSSVIAGGTHAPHKIQGIGTGFIPAVLDRATLDGTISVTEEAAFEFARRAAKEEGIFVGASSGATLAAVHRKLPELRPGSRILAFCYDTGERYLSVDGLFPEGQA